MMTMRRSSLRLKWQAGYLVLGSILVFAMMMRSPTGAAAAGGWSTPELITSMTGTNLIRDPVVVTDRAGGVHVFWRLTLPDSSGNGAPSRTIDYAQSGGSRWSTPTDITTGPGANPTAAVDNYGRVHLFWWGANAEIFRSSAMAASATSAGAWTPPIPFGTGNANGQVVADSRGNLHLVYPGFGAAGLFYETSSDGGSTWSFPVTIANGGPNVSVDFTRIAVAPDGTIHVVWSEYPLPKAWPPSGLYYARSTDGGKTWSNPIQIAGPGFNQLNVAAGPNQTVYVAWNGMAGVRGRYGRRSTDGGKTWSAAIPMTIPIWTDELGGSTGPPGLVVDSAGVAHALFIEAGRIWLNSWEGQGWSQAEVVPPTENKGYTEQAVMTLSQGNRIHVVFWREQPDLGVTNLWYVTKDLAAPALPPVPFLSSKAGASVAAEEHPRATVSSERSTRSIEAGMEPPVPSSLFDARTTIPLALVPTTILIAGALLLRIRFIRSW